jgi:hypothetical protein
MTTPNPWIPQKVYDLGHRPVLDGNQRWTCTVCHAAVLRYGRNVYGSATQRHCTNLTTTQEATR